MSFRKKAKKKISVYIITCFKQQYEISIQEEKAQDKQNTKMSAGQKQKEKRNIIIIRI